MHSILGLHHWSKQSPPIDHSFQHLYRALNKKYPEIGPLSGQDISRISRFSRFFAQNFVSLNFLDFWTF